MNLESKYLKSLRKSKQNTFQSTSINFDYATPTAKDKLFFYPLNPKDLYINRILTNSDKVTCIKNITFSNNKSKKNVGNQSTLAASDNKEIKDI